VVPVVIRVVDREGRGIRRRVGWLGTRVGPGEAVRPRRVEDRVLQGCAAAAFRSILPVSGVLVGPGLEHLVAGAAVWLWLHSSTSKWSIFVLSRPRELLYLV
jgi:hypothetical protein